MSPTHLAWFVLALALRLLLAIRANVEWLQILPDSDPDLYRNALNTFRWVVLPQVNAAREKCGMPVAIGWLEVLADLLVVESSGTSYRLILKSGFEVSFRDLVVTFDQVGEKWAANPHPCKLASSGLDVAVPLSEDDRFVQMGLITLTEIMAAECGLAERFVPLGVLGAVMVAGTPSEEVEIHVLGPVGPHRIHFEFSGAEPKLVSSDVPVCELARRSLHNSSIIQISSSLYFSDARPKRSRSITEETDKRARTSRNLNAPRGEVLLPKYSGRLEKEFHWAEAVPECFGYGPEVQDQGSCGSSWAFATLGALSDRHCLAYGRSAMSWPDGGLKRFSVQDFLSCHLGEKDGCKGGSVEDGVTALMENRFSFDRQSPYFSKCYIGTSGMGVVNDDTQNVNCSEYSHLPDDPANNKPCICWAARPHAHPTCNESVPRQKVQVAWGSIRAHGDLSLPKRVELIMRYIREGGPVAAAFDLWDDFKPFVASVPDEPYYRYDANAKWRGSHGVVITGWGVSEKGKPYWWARNSWGPDWGTKGYFKIARGSNSVGLENHIAFSVVKDECIDPNLLAGQRNQPSYSTFGIRLPWSHDMVTRWGRILPDKTSPDHLYRFEPSDVDEEPIIARFDTRKSRVRKDVFTSEGIISGHFHLLVVEIPFSCSEPCTIWSSETYQAIGSAGEVVDTLRFLEMKLDDNSWSRGVLSVYIDQDDPLQGKSQGEIHVSVGSRLWREISGQMEREGMDIFKVKDWNKIPWRSSNHTVSLPRIPSHQEPDHLPEPVLPLDLSVQTKTVDGAFGKHLKLMLAASEPSVYYVRVLDKETNEVLLASTVEQPPDRCAWLQIGGSNSVGGPSFKYFFFPGEIGYGRMLSIEIEARCQEYAKPMRRNASVDIQWPQSNTSSVIAAIRNLWRAWEDGWPGGPQRV